MSYGNIIYRPSYTQNILKCPRHFVLCVCRWTTEPLWDELLLFGSLYGWVGLGTRDVDHWNSMQGNGLTTGEQLHDPTTCWFLVVFLLWLGLLRTFPISASLLAITWEKARLWQKEATKWPVLLCAILTRPWSSTFNRLAACRAGTWSSSKSLSTKSSRWTMGFKGASKTTNGPAVVGAANNDIHSGGKVFPDFNPWKTHGKQRKQRPKHSFLSPSDLL